jgi:hypothetical protein
MGHVFLLPLQVLNVSLQFFEAQRSGRLPTGTQLPADRNMQTVMPCVVLLPLQVLNVSLQFFEAQRSGRLPRISNVPWRGNSAVFDSVLMPGNRNVSLTGGW